MSPKRYTRSHIKEHFAVAVTASRYAFAEWAAQNVYRQKPIVIPLGLFVLSDLLDGVMARRIGAETQRRRVVDGIVDYVSITRVGIATAATYETTRPLLFLLALREGLVGATNILSYRKTGQVVQGGGVHKADVLSIASAGVLAGSGYDTVGAKAVEAGAIAINYLTASDYIANAIRPHGNVTCGVRKINFEFLRR